jgi:hypothetical protein
MEPAAEARKACGTTSIVPVKPANTMGLYPLRERGLNSQYLFTAFLIAFAV